MTEDIVVRLEERTKALRERVEKLETNQRWAVIAIIALVLDSLFNIVTKGVGP